MGDDVGLTEVRLWVKTDRGKTAVWIGAVWILALGITVTGLGYVTGFYPGSPPAYAAFLRVPGGLHTHGLIQFCIGAGLIQMLWPRWFYPIPHERRILRIQVGLVIVGVYSGCTAAAFLMAPLFGGQRNPGWILWTVFLALSFYYTATAPDERASTTSAPRHSRSASASDQP